MALWYPILVLSLAYGLFLGLVIEIIPRFIGAFESLGLEVIWPLRRLVKVDDQVQLGESWISALERQGIIQTSDAQVLISASGVGNLAWALRELAETSQRRLAFRFQAVIQTLFPLVALGLGMVVMFLAVAFFAPLVTLLWRLS